VETTLIVLALAIILVGLIFKNKIMEDIELIQSNEKTELIEKMVMSCLYPF
jgi:hypothetical protein